MFNKGSGNVMPGFDLEPLGVSSGIPPKLTYGLTGKKPKIPSNADLEIEVEVVKITKGVIEKVSVSLCRKANVAAGIYLNFNYISAYFYRLLHAYLTP